MSIGSWLAFEPNQHGRPELLESPAGDFGGNAVCQTRRMELAEFAEAVDREGHRLLDVAAIDPDAAVPSCPGWEVTQLVEHIGRVYGYVASVVRQPSPDRPAARFSDFAPDGEIVQWGREQLDTLLVALAGVEAGTPCWNWGPEDTVDFFPRRMAHESVVHRRDVEEAIGDLTPLDSDLAADGVDELVHVGLSRSLNPNREFTYPGGSLHLHRTDGDGEWLLRPTEGGLVVTREHAKGDVAVRGSGSDLFLYLWGRGGDDLEIFGDPELANAWSQVAP